MNKEKKLYGQLLMLEMEKEEVLQVVEKFYSDWKTQKEFVDLGYEILRHIKEKQIEEKFDFVSIQSMIDDLINVEEPLCTPNEFEEALKQLELRGKIYQSRKDYYKITGLNHGR